MFDFVILLYGILYFIVFVFGICIGSFLNVCIYRIPLKISVVGGRSFCPACKKQLKGFDMIPIISYLFLVGKCRFCKHKISLRYPLVETLTGILYITAFFFYGFTIKSAVISLFLSVLVLVSFIDWDTGLIPDSLILSILVLVPFCLLTGPLVYSLPEHLLGLVIISVPMLLIAYLTQGFGGGDIKLMAACGLFMGARLIVFAAGVGVILGAVYGIFLLLHKKAEGKTQIPFGPFLSVGMLFSLCIGNRILEWYISLMV